jgi:hypothetical protein
VIHRDREYARTWQSWMIGSWEELRCPVCGLLYVRESEADRRVHRSRHRQVLQVYEPKPDPRLAAYSVATDPQQAGKIIATYALKCTPAQRMF